MPPKKYNRKKKTYRKRYNKKYFKKKYNNKIVTKYGFPNAIYTKLVWTTSVNLTSGTLAERQVNLNSLYDPGSSLWSTQPMMFD